VPCNVTVPILSNDCVADGVFRMAAPWSGEEARPGQFFMLKSPSGASLLPRPISVCDIDGGNLIFLYQVVGRGTGELSALRAGDSIALTGPLGNGFPVGNIPDKIALVGGGIGIAPMLLTARVLKKAGVHVTVLAGFRDKPFLAGDLAEASDRFEVATESGFAGTKGFVTAILDSKAYGAVYCCGPEPMMKAVVNLCIDAETPVYVSLENKMACGIGACLVCTCADKEGHNRRTCKDGPVFRGEEINFDA
jgi:dihydroorotate dehydrogenase electron transfer subunit